MLVQLLAWAVIGAMLVGQPTQGVVVPHDRGATPPKVATCGSYCRGYLSACGDSIAFATAEQCEQTCEGWRRSEALTCRVAVLASPSPSCIAAGPASPICQR